MEYNEWVLAYNGIENRLFEMAKQLVGKTMVYIQSSYDGNKFKSGLVEIKSKNYMTIYFDNLRPYFEYYVDGEIVNLFEKCDDYVRIAIFNTDLLVPEKIQQKYLDGVKHCVIEPIRLMFQNYANNATTKDSRRKFTSVINKLNEIEPKYSDGVPEEEMEIIA